MEEKLFEIKRCRSNDREDAVKLSLVNNYTYKDTSKKNLRCNIIIGNNLISELNWEVGDMITGEVYSNYIILKKEKDFKRNQGFKLRSVKNSYSCIVTFPAFFGSNTTNKRIRIVKNEIIDVEFHYKETHIPYTTTRVDQYGNTIEEHIDNESFKLLKVYYKDNKKYK